MLDMQLQRLAFLTGFSALALLMSHGSPRAQQTSPPADAAGAAGEARDRCDRLASLPGDPDIFAAPVADDQFAPGAARTACEDAVRLNPDLPRAWFQLGRAYWLSQRDSDAFKAFLEAAKRGYAPAMKSLGDAYLEGRGLPSGDQRDALAAIEWYKKSAASGFRLAEKAIKEAQELINRHKAEEAKAKFDASIFQNSRFMAALYNSTPVAGSDGEAFIKYVYGFAEKLSGDTIIFLEGGQYCKQMINATTSTRLRNGFVAAMTAQALRDNGRCSLLSGGRCPNIDLTAYNRDYEQGERDAVALFNRYGCQSDVTRKIVNGMNQFADSSPRVQSDPATRQIEPYLNGSCAQFFAQWKRAPAHGAFAATSTGSCGYTHSQDSLVTARERAMRQCVIRGPGCKIVYER